jgi:hypothetical protein
VASVWNPTRPPFASRLIIVGGQCSKVGKTSLVTDLIIALPNFEWTAVKITPHAESGCPVNGSGCNCAATDHSFAILEESHRNAATDTSRFLAAGAKRALWVQTKTGRLEAALAGLVAALQAASHIIIESNAILEFWRPAGLIVILDPSNPDFKQSAQRILPLASAFVLRSPPAGGKTADVAGLDSPGKPIFLQPFGAPLPTGVQERARQLLHRAEHPLGGVQAGHYTGFRG